MRKARGVRWALGLLFCSIVCGLGGLALDVTVAGAQTALDETTLSNVDAQITKSFFGLRFNRSTNTYIGFLTIKNTSGTSLPTPLYLVVTAVTPGSVSVVNAPAQTLQTHPYYNLSQLVPGSSLDPQETTARLQLEFRNPTNVALQVTASVLIPRPPQPTNHPPVLATIGDRTVREGDSLQFSVTATDPDGDQVTLSSGPLPANAHFDAATGMFTFQPDFTQAGMVSVPFTATDNGSPPMSTSAMVQMSIVDVPPPTVTLLSPGDGLLTRVPMQAVSGTVSDTSVTMATLHHHGATQSLPVTHGTFDLALSLVEGLNILSVSASNAAGTGMSTDVHVTLDTIPPQLTISTPLDHAVLFAPQVRVAGTVDDSTAQVHVNGQPAPVHNGQWEVANIALALGQQPLLVTATDLAGNSAQQTLHVTRQTVALQAITVTPAATRLSMAGAQQPLVVTGQFADGSTQDLTAASTGTAYESSNPFVASVSADGVVTAIANGATMIMAHQQTLSAAARVTVEIGVTLSALDLTPAMSTLRAAGVLQPLHLTGTFSDASTRDLTATTTGTVYTSSDSAVATVSPAGVVTAMANGATTITATNEQLSTTAQVMVAISGGPGFVRGEVYDDTMGLPLAHATVTLLADGRGPLTTPVVVVADARGQFLLPGMAGEAILRIDKAGFTSAERQGTIPQNTALTLLDARLTLLDAQPNSLTSALGGQARDSTNTLSLDFAPGSLGTDTAIQVTALSNQGLQGQLPLGWSPIAAVDVQPAGLVLGQPALLHAPNAVNLLPNSPVMLALYDTQAHRWMVHEPAQVTSDSRQIVAFISTLGQMALLVPDAAPFNPPTPQVGQVLPGVAAGPLPTTLTGTGEVVPRSAPPGPGARATGRLVLEAWSPLPSGTAVQAHVSERFDLFDMSRVVPLPFTQDLLLYAQPRRSNAPSLSTTFPITPSVQFTLQDLQLGTVRLDITMPDSAIGGTVVGAHGGTVADPTGHAVEVPSGALSTETVLDLVPLTPNQLQVTLPNDVTLLAAVQLELGGATLAQAALLSIPSPTGLPSGTQVIVAQVVSDPAGLRRLRLVALGEVQATRLVTRGTVGNLTFPGVTGAGQYVFLQPPAPLGFVTGTIFSTNGLTPQALAVVTTDTAPFAAITGLSGTYIVAGAVGAVQVTALVQETGDTAMATTSVAAPDAVVPLDLTLQTVAPHVVAVAPTDNAKHVPLDTSILVQFSAAVNQDSVDTNSVQLMAGSTPVSGQVRVAPDGLSATFTPAARLTSNTLYSLTVTAAIVDRARPAGHALVPFAASFTTLNTSLPRDVAGQITATAPNAQGLVTVHGTAGVAEAGQAVGVINNTSSVIVTAVANADGSFAIAISATTTDLLTVNLRTAAGSDTTVQIGSYMHPDGSVTLGELGGRISASTPDGPITLDIPSGALAGPTTVQLTPVSEAEAQAELAQMGLSLPTGPGAPVFGGALKIDAPGGFAKTRLTLAVPVPPGLAAQAAAAGRTLDQVQTTLVRVEQVEEDGQTRFGFREVDSARVINGRLVDGDEHDGVGGVFGGFYIFFPFPQVSTAYVNGRVFIADDPHNPLLTLPPETAPCPDPDPGVAQMQMCRAPGAIVRAFSPLFTGSPLFYAVTTEFGRYAVSVPATNGTVIAVTATRVDAVHPVGSSVRSLGLAPIRDLILQRKPPPPDTTPPTVRVLLSAVTAPLGTPVTITVTATDNDNRPASLTALDGSITLSTVGPGNAPPALTLDPTDQRRKTTFVPNTVGTYQFTATAQDASGNRGMATATLVVGPFQPPPGINPQPGDSMDRVPPIVVSVDPPRDARGVFPEDVITVRFSEPVDRAIELLPVFFQVVDPARTLTGTVSLSPDQTTAVLRPAGGLTPGTMYQIRVAGVQDLNGNVLDQDPLSSGAQPFVSDFSTLSAPTPVVVSSVPISPTAPTLGFNIRASRESTVVGNTLFFTDADNSDRQGRILIFDVSNPQQPVALSEILTNGQPRAMTVVPEFSYLGLDGHPSFFPHRQGFVGEPPLQGPRAMLFAVVFKQLDSGLSGSFLQFYDVTDPAQPQPIGANQRLSFASIGTKIKVVGDRAFIKLVDRPNPGLVVVDLRLALLKATLLPINQIRNPDGSLIPSPSGEGLIDADASGSIVRDFLGTDTNGDGDFGDPGDTLPDINANNDIVAGRFVSPGDLTDFDVSANGQRLFVADGLPLDLNGMVDLEPNTGLQGPFYGVAGVGPSGLLQADAAGGLLTADLSTLVPFPLLDVTPRDGLDDRVLARMNTPTDTTDTASTRVRLAEGLAFTQSVITLENNVQVRRDVAVVKDVVFISNAFAGTVTMLDVDDPHHPQRLAVIKLPQVNGAQLQPVELSISGSQLFIDATGSTVEVDLNRTVLIDQTGAQPVLVGLQPIDADGNGVDDRIVRTLPGVIGNGVVAPSGYAFGGTNSTAQIAPVDLPRLEFVRFTGTPAELAQFNPAQPGDRANAALLQKLQPVTFLNPGRLHMAPHDPAASDAGERTDPQYVYFVRTIMPAHAAANDGTVPLTIESLTTAGVPLPDLGYAFPPTSYNSPRPGTTGLTPRVLKLHRQIDTASLDNGTNGQRLSALGTVYISHPIFLTREPLRAADLAQNTGPFVLWPGTAVRASLAGGRAGVPGVITNARVPDVYVPGVTDLATRQKVLGRASVTARSFAADLVDSPQPNPYLNPSTGMGEATGPVYLHNGEFTWEQVDLTIRGRGLPYAFVRQYESQSFYNGPLGRGWEFTYNMRLQEVPEALPDSFRLTLVERPGGPNDVAQPGDVLCYDGSGRVDLYAFTVNGVAMTGPDGNDPDELAADLGLNQPDRVERHYKSPRGFFTKLFKLKDGTFIVLERDGTRHRFGVHGQLVSSTDRNRNRLDFLYDDRLRLRAVVDTMGRLIRFGYYKIKGAADDPDFVAGLDIDDPLGVHDGKIARQRDFIGREVQYIYDARNRLSQVISPAVNACHGAGDCFSAGKTMQYEYADVELTDVPRYSFPLATITSPRQLATGGSPRIRNTYEDGKLKTQVWGTPATQTIMFAYAGTATTVTDRRGYPATYTHDGFGHATMTLERGGFPTQRQFDHPDGLVTLLTLPEHNTVASTYDDGNARRRSQGNLLTMTRETGPRPPGGSASTLMTRHDDRDYDLRYNLVRSTRDPGGFQTTYDYDERGNLLTITRPTITHPTGQEIVERFTYTTLGQKETATDGEGNVTRFVYHAETQPDDVRSTPVMPLRELDSGTGGYLHQVIVNASTGDNAGAGASPAGLPAPPPLTTTYLYGPFAGSAQDIGYAGNPTAVDDPRGVRTEFGVNELNQVFRRRLATTAAADSQFAPALQYEQRFFYDANGMMTRKEIQHDAAAFTVYRYPVYDLLDHVKVMEVDTGNETLITRYDYDPNQNLMQVIKPFGNRDRYTYEERDLPETVTRGFGSSVASTTRYMYDGNRNLRLVTDGRGNAGETQGMTELRYDGFDRRRMAIDRMQNTAEFEYDNNGLLRTLRRRGPVAGQGAMAITANDLLQHITYDYDEIYRRTDVREQIIGASPEIDGVAQDDINHTQYQYDRNSRLVQTTDDNGHEQRRFYDGANRLIASVDHLNNTMVYSHDANGNVIMTEEREVPSGTFISMAQFDAVNRVAQSTDPLGNTRQFVEYDAQNNLRRLVDAEQNVVLYTYDLINRLKLETRTGPVGPPVTMAYTYDLNSRRKTLTDSRGNVTTYEVYDDLDRLTMTRYPDGATTVAMHDANSNVHEFRDQNGNTIMSQYDASDRLISRQVTLARGQPLPDGVDATMEAYEYDGLDRLTLARDEDSTVEMIYDAPGRVTREIQSRPSTGLMRVTESRFDGVGNRTRLLYPSGPEVIYIYDALDRIQDVKSPLAASHQSILAHYDYLGPERVQRRIYANNMHLDLGYDLNPRDRRVSKVAHSYEPPGQPRIVSFDFRYNWTPEHQRVGEQRLHDGGVIDLYSYDSVYRLTQVQHDGRTAPGTTLDIGFGQGQAPTLQNVGRSRTYAYDGADNLTTATRAGAVTAPSFPDEFSTPSPRNQYDILTELGQARTQHYDPNGNTTQLRLERRDKMSPHPSFGAAEVTYDYRDQPIFIAYVGSQDKITYRYDALGRRIEKLVEVGGTIEQTSYLHNDDREIEERDTADVTQARYIYGRRLDEVLVMERFDPITAQFLVRYYHENSLGSIVGLTDESAQEVEHYRYDAYGTPLLEAVDFTPPQVFQARTVGTDLEIDFTESLMPGDFSGLVLINGTPAVSITLLGSIVNVPSGLAAGTVPVTLATLHASPAVPLAVGAPVTVIVLPAAGANHLRDFAGNDLTTTFSTTFLFPMSDSTVFTSATAVVTGPRPLALSEAGNPWLFQSRRYDPETGLYYYRARYYMPSTGRFLQNDPKGYVDGPNLYAAFGNDPVNNLDPYGYGKVKAALGWLKRLIRKEARKPVKETKGELEKGIKKITKELQEQKAPKGSVRELEEQQAIERVKRQAEEKARREAIRERKGKKKPDPNNKGFILVDLLPIPIIWEISYEISIAVAEYIIEEVDSGVQCAFGTECSLTDEEKREATEWIKKHGGSLAPELLPQDEKSMMTPKEEKAPPLSPEETEQIRRLGGLGIRR